MNTKTYQSRIQEVLFQRSIPPKRRKLIKECLKEMIYLETDLVQSLYDLYITYKKTPHYLLTMTAEDAPLYAFQHYEINIYVNISIEMGKKLLEDTGKSMG